MRIARLKDKDLLPKVPKKSDVRPPRAKKTEFKKTRSTGRGKGDRKDEIGGDKDLKKGRVLRIADRMLLAFGHKFVFSKLSNQRKSDVEEFLRSERNSGVFDVMFGDAPGYVVFRKRGNRLYADRELDVYSNRGGRWRPVKNVIFAYGRK